MRKRQRNQSVDVKVGKEDQRRGITSAQKIGSENLGNMLGHIFSIGNILNTHLSSKCNSQRVLHDLSQ